MAFSPPYISFYSEHLECMHAKLLSAVQIFVTLRTVACQAPLPMAFSRQEYWSGLPWLPPAERFGTPCSRMQPWRLTDIKWNSSLIIFYCEAWKCFLISLSFSFKKWQFENINNYFIGLYWELNEMMFMKGLISSLAHYTDICSSLFSNA